MTTLEQRRRRVSTTLVRHSTDWGVSVSEKRVRKFWLNGVLLILSILVMLGGLMVIVPLLAGLFFSRSSTLVTGW